MNKHILLIACFLAISSALHVKLNHEATFSAGPVNLKADNGLYLARCHTCGPSVYPDVASVH